MATDVLDAAAPRSLAPLRARLEAVRRRRLLARRITAWCAVGVGLLAALLVALALDRLFLLPRAGRLWLWAGIIASLAWTFRRYAWPHLAVHETELDVALSMERAHGIDSDFVAALQFERPESAGWGSQTLRSAVVDYVSEFGRQWTTAAPLWSPQLARRSAWAAGLAAIIVAVGVASPGTLRAFVNRMFLGSMHYPTWTRIERLVIAGREIDPSVEATVRAPIGRPLRIEVGCGGRIPADGFARFTPTDGEGRASVSLEAGDPSSVLVGELANLTESATMEVQAGDAWTSPVRIEAVAAPVVEASLHVEPPAYARAAAPAASSGRQAAVLEGSNVSLAVTCLNKDLERADVVIDGVAHPLTRQPADAPGGRDRFVLSGSGSPLAGIRMPVQYEVRAVDVDGLSPDRAPAGAIRIRPDAPPQVSAEAITRAVLPTARPTISFTVKDDYGIAAARATVEIVRGDLRPSDAPVADSAARAIEILPASAPPWIGDALPRTGRVVLPLADLAVRKGDFVRVVVEAVDHRGSDPGQPAASPPIDLTVTDENGVIQALEASESQAAEELQAIIQEQLGVGETR